MTGNVIFFRDYDRLRDPDAVLRDPADADVVIILPVIRIERHDVAPPHAKGKRR